MSPRGRREPKPSPFGDPDSASNTNGYTAPRKGPPMPMTPVSQDMALMIAEVNERRTRILELEAQVRAEQEGRRADVERLTNQNGEIRQESHKEVVDLMRELIDAKMTIARLETELRLRADTATTPPQDSATPGAKPG